jgi:hypothetical protein
MEAHLVNGGTSGELFLEARHAAERINPRPLYPRAGIKPHARAFTGVLASIELRADPKGRTSTPADSLFHERHQNRKVHRLQEGTLNSPASAAAAVAMKRRQ